jgi:hypothetical protein
MQENVSDGVSGIEERSPAKIAESRAARRGKVNKAVIGCFQFEEASILGVGYGFSRIMLGVALFLIAWNSGLGALARGQTNDRVLDLQCRISSAVVYCSDPLGGICYARVNVRLSFPFRVALLFVRRSAAPSIFCSEMIF